MVRSPPRALAGALLVALGALGPGARVEAQKLDAEQLHPAATSSSYLGLDSPSVLPHLRGSAGLVFAFGHHALVLRDPGGVVLPGGQLVATQAWLEAIGSVGLFDRFEIGLALPVALTQTGDLAPLGRDPAAALRKERGAALGDLRLDVKVLAIDHSFGGDRRVVVGVPAPATGHRLRLALVVGITAPTSTTALAGEGNATGRPRLVFEWAYRRVRLLVSVGAILRERSSTLGLDVTHQLTWGLGARYILWRQLELTAEARGAIGVGIPAAVELRGVEAPVELDVAVAYTIPLGLRLFVGGGIGLGHGYGVPAGRFLAGARYTMPAARRELTWDDEDADHDGVRNRLDRCVREVGPAENEGCPELDFDADGVVDRLDRCPERAGLAENHGCPEYDTDGDNVPDRVDRCPKEAGSPLADGCPLKDADQDGVPDDRDRCPALSGTASNDGCPEVDSDGDGLLDRVDSCPFDAEVYNAVLDEDGCPDPGAALTGLAAGRVAIFETIAFEKIGATERLSAPSVKVVAAIGHLLAAHGELARLRIEGHTDNRGSAVENLDLSLARAQLVRRQLVEVHKIDARRLTSQGFGGNRPLADNARPEGRARNRRIEITILDTAK